MARNLPSRTDIVTSTRTVCAESHRGVLRLAGEVVWECGHIHRRRDQYTQHRYSGIVEAVRMVGGHGPAE